MGTMQCNANRTRTGCPDRNSEARVQSLGAMETPECALGTELDVLRLRGSLELRELAALQAHAPEDAIRLLKQSGGVVELLQGL